MKTRKRSLIMRAAVVVSAAVFFLAARSTSPSEPLYYALPANLPAWAEQGAFRFIRIDGGDIESWKAERTWWGKEFSADEKDVLANIYGRDFDQMLGLLQAAHFNWIWVTWSNGWSLATESRNRDQLARVIARCHDNNIRVTAYMSATNMFWQDTMRTEPRTLLYGLWMYGLPIFYAGVSPETVQVNFQRRMADVRLPEWRAYLVNKAALAVDAGADAIFFDNLIGDTFGMRLLLSDVQRMAEQKAAASGRPKALIYANVHITPYRFDVFDHCDLVWDEPGKDTPGVWNGIWQVDNVRRIKFLEGEKKTWQPLKYENDRYHCGPRERCIPTPVEQKLSIAEAYAFGAALSRNIEGRFLYGLIRDEKPAQEAWAAIAKYNGFIAEHVGFYRGVRPAARIALLAQAENDREADSFIRSDVIFETKVLAHLDKGEPLENFRVLIVPFKLSRLEAVEKKILSDFIAGQGVIFCPDPDALAVNLGGADLLRLKAIPAPFLKDLQAGKPVPEFLKIIEKAADGPLLKIENSKYLVANVTRKDDAFLVHLLNYDHDVPNQNVKLKLDLSPYLQDLSGFAVQAFSPDDSAPQIMGLAQQGATLEFTLDQVQHYVVVTVAKTPI